MTYEDWVDAVPANITGDPLWKIEAYRLALFIADLGWHDVTKLSRDKRMLEVSNQLYRALGSIGANISEGSGRGSLQDNRRFVRMARGSLYETIHWLRQSYLRKLLTQSQVKELRLLVEELAPKLNAFLRSVDKRVESK